MRKNLGLSAEKCFFYFILIYPIINVASSWFFGNAQIMINRMIFCIMALCANYRWIRTKNRMGMIIDIVIVLNCIYIRDLRLIMHTDNIDFFNFLICMTLWEDKRLCYRFRRFINDNQCIMLMCIIFTLLSIVISITCEIGFIEAQRSKILIGFFKFEHGLAYHVLILYAMTFMLDNKKHKTFVLVLKAVLAGIIIFTGVRSAALVLIIMMLFDYTEQSSLTKLMIAVVGVFVLIGVWDRIEDVKRIPIVEKTIRAADIGDVTNGRYDLNQIGLNCYFNKTSTVQKWFGYKMNELRNEYEVLAGNRFHAHNDFINILLGYGIANLIIAVTVLIRFAERPLKLLMILMLGILAYTNGLFMYLPFVVMLPIFKAGLHTAYEKRHFISGKL